MYGKISRLRSPNTSQRLAGKKHQLCSGRTETQDHVRLKFLWLPGSNCRSFGQFPGRLTRQILQIKNQHAQFAMTGNGRNLIGFHGGTKNLNSLNYTILTLHKDYSKTQNRFPDLKKGF
jgi:hypothetical protein